MGFNSANNLLVTGAGGYVGTRLVHQALQRGYKVKAFDRYFFGKEKLLKSDGHPNLEIIEGDVRSINSMVFFNVNAVVDLAGISNDPSSDLDPELTRSINFDGCVRVARMAKESGVQRFIAMSSCSVYGASEDVCVESARHHPVSLYAQIKSQMEDAVMPLADKDFCITALRNSTGFGPSDRMRFDLVVNEMTLKGMHESKLIIVGDGSQHRPLIHVEDVGEVCCDLLEQNPTLIAGEVFNVGACNSTVLDVASKVQSTLERLLRKEICVESTPQDKDARDYAVSFEKYRSAFGKLPSRTIERAVEEIVFGLQTGRLIADESAFTVQRYKSLIRQYGSSLLLP